MKERPDVNPKTFSESRVRDEGTMGSGDRSLKQILLDIVNHVNNIIRSEVQLAKTEVRQDVTDYARASTFIGVAGVLALYAVGFVLLSAVYALQGVLSPWLAAVVVGVAAGIAAAILYAIGRKRLAQANIRRQQIIRRVEDNVTWFKRQTR